MPGEALSVGALYAGVDFGTDAVRVAAFDDRGLCLGVGTAAYPRWAQGLYCDPGTSRYRQHPLDYIEALQAAFAGLPAVVRNAVVALTVATTGSTPAAVDAKGRPLALSEPFADDPDAMFLLWKDHSALAEAARITEVAHGGDFEDYTRFGGGSYSPEWFWAKALHVLRTSPKVRAHAWSWVEHSDWIAAELTGVQAAGEVRRNRCAAGHKGMWRQDHGGLPSESFWRQVDPLLEGRTRLYTQVHSIGELAGSLCEAWAARLGLRVGVAVGVSALDAHMGAVGAGVQPGVLVKVIGTSTCDMTVTPLAALAGSDGRERVISGVCGQADGSILPGLIGIEAGQSAFGDVYAWFADLVTWPMRQLGEPVDAQAQVLAALGAAAAALPPDASGPVALDWFNGRRSPDLDMTRRAAIEGLDLSIDAPRLFRTLVESTTFGARAIVDRMHAEGLPITRIVAVGGVAERSPLVMQVLADVLDRPIELSGAAQACALGGAMAAATAAGRFATLQEAQAAMGADVSIVYRPKLGGVGAYNELYARYQALARATP